MFLLLHSLNQEPPEKLEEYLAIVWNISNFASILSILLVAVYQLITIRIDPFGAQNIITTPRCFGACSATWATAIAIAFIGRQITENPDVVASVGASITLIITGICYVLIYRAVAKTMGGAGGGEVIRGRREENKRVLRTFGFVYLTTVFLWLFIVVYVSTMISLNDVVLKYNLEVNLFNLNWLIVELNWIANSGIYWWRLREFRSILSRCFHRVRRKNALGPDDMSYGPSTVMSMAHDAN